MKHFVSGYIIESDDDRDGGTLQGKKEKKEYYTTDRHTYVYVITNTVTYYAKEKQEE